MTGFGMSFNEADTRAKLIDPAIHKRGWTEDQIRREETAGAIEIVGDTARRRLRVQTEPATQIKSWTVDLDERKRAAVEEARPLKKRADNTRRQTAEWKARVTKLKKAKPLDRHALEHAEATCRELDREAKNLAARAKDIEDAVYDLKAVNPAQQYVVDARTPEELTSVIEEKGRELAEALALLRRAGRTTI